ncbi:hypothetical protein [Bianquea renquensis]|uniref:Uncharacterized protein n=1 Tax=Bianquea renquensis TaxID=2763661 RepID=A0A926I0A6_9FIRM|nr:hypothetical protein [Bianquea renquensis]MBC8542015.1 hypothetical protein [Bianquea renquensis]
MMTRQDISREITRSELPISKIIQGAWRLFSERWIWYLLLTVLVFFPSTLVVQYAAGLINPETAEIQDLIKVYMAVILMSFVWIIGTLVSAVMVNAQLRDEPFSFGTAFYKGICAWPKAIATVLLLMAILIGIAMAGMLAVTILPLLAVPFITALLIGSVVFSAALYFAAITAALRKKMFMDNLKYVVYILRGHFGKSIGLFMLLFLGSLFVSYGVGVLEEPLLALIANSSVRWIVQSFLDSLLSITNIFMFIGLTIYFLNLESIRLEEEAARAEADRLPLP